LLSVEIALFLSRLPLQIISHKRFLILHA